MSTKISLVLLAFLFIMMGLVYISCESPVDSGPMYRGMIQGWVYDDSTKEYLTGVKVFANEILDTVYTNDSGRFYIDKISMPRSEYGYNLIFKRFGYNDFNEFVFIKSDVLFIIDSVLMKKSKN